MVEFGRFPSWFLFPLALSPPRAGFPPTTREKGKKERRGGGKKGTPPGASNANKSVKRKDECNAEGTLFVLIARGEADTEWENKKN